MKNVKKWFRFLKYFRKFQGNAANSGISNLNSFESRKKWEEPQTSCLLYEFPAETRLTVYRRLDILTHSSNSRALPPRRSVMLGVNISIQMILCIWVTSSVLFKVFKSYWSLIFTEYQLLRSSKLEFWTDVSLFKNVDILMDIFKIFRKLLINGAVAVWQRAVNRQPGSRARTRRAGASPLSFFQKNRKIFFRKFLEK